MPAKSKLLEGYLYYLKNSDDPNLLKCREEHGENAIYASIEAWKSEMLPEDRDLIPSEEFVGLCRKRINC